jgi:acetyl esterase/lipase
VPWQPEPNRLNLNKVRNARVDRIDAYLSTTEAERIVSEKSIPVQGGEIKIRIYVPVPTATESANARYPVLVFVHGGGWVVGDLEAEDIACNFACVHARLVVVNVDYRLAPEFPFPIPLNDSYTALKWVLFYVYYSIPSH